MQIFHNMVTNLTVSIIHSDTDYHRENSQRFRSVKPKDYEMVL